MRLDNELQQPVTEVAYYDQGVVLAVLGLGSANTDFGAKFSNRASFAVGAGVEACPAAQRNHVDV